MERRHVHRQVADRDRVTHPRLTGIALRTERDVHVRPLAEPHRMRVDPRRETSVAEGLHQLREVAADARQDRLGLRIANRALNSITFQPSAVLMSPAYSTPRYGVPRCTSSSRRAR